MLLVALAQAALPVDVPPEHRLTDWGAALRTGGGERVAMIVEATDEGPLRVEVLDGARWKPLREVFQLEGTRVMVADLDARRTEIRLRSPDRDRIRSVDWDLFTPVRERRGPPRGERRASLPSELVAIGVVSRAGWGAADTTCTSTEDDWYRMAIHHTAGTQTYGGSVQGAVQVLQSYSMSGGEYCDIPYQFLVGYDGSLWEGRPYGYYSGATGDNNDGNIAVCFLGCYHPSDCPNGAGDAVTEAMVDGGQLLVQTLAGLHAISSDSDAIRGHRDWPGNSTACPGDWLYDRLDDLREPLGPDWAATLVSSSFPSSLSLQVGESYTGSYSFTNSGRQAWTPGSTKLGTLPRDSESALYDASWYAVNRPATVAAETAPGGTGSFGFTVRANEVGEYDASFGLVQEGVAWFADDGGPAEGSLSFHVSVTEASSPTDSDPPDSAGSDSARPPGAEAREGLGPGELRELSSFACGCTGARGGSWLGLVALLALRRR